MARIVVILNFFTCSICPLDTGRKLNVHNTSRTSFERLMYVLFTSCALGGAFYFSWGKIMVRFLIRDGFWDATLIRGRKLLEDGAYSGLSINSAVLIRGRRLPEARGLLEEVRLVITLFSLKFKIYIYIYI